MKKLLQITLVLALAFTFAGGMFATPASASSAPTAVSAESCVVVGWDFFGWSLDAACFPGLIQPMRVGWNG